MKVVKKGLRAVAILEACKGIASLLVGFGLHVLAGHNMRQLAENIVSRLHLNPAGHLPSIFIHAASGLTDARMGLLAIGALVYSAIRLVEAYGLWQGLVWTEWFALVSGAIYLPFEVYEMIFHTNLLGIGVFFINVLIVAYMAYALYNERKMQREHSL
ncbi:DUF2127 domain-containing protein [Aliivibrio fischeri]|uniref:DUF2127 domain-containing protein n=1 Tax=Aliivibrio fischeri TaxID=668 RepID=UPI0007C4E0B1|nr:DUF2127 domain-containing protein [Aliivibrio fischeri]MCE7576237.1 DUF2127 domain-containing protein [Aliivibrio fischeri]MCE7588527.1 DUF2127 domain-containing protein [Aliivibrio fischeri]